MPLSDADEEPLSDTVGVAVPVRDADAPLDLDAVGVAVPLGVGDAESVAAPVGDCDGKRESGPSACAR